MKLKSGFITHESADEHITVSAGGMAFSGMIRSNKTAGFIVECLKEDVTEAQIVEKLLQTYDADRSQVEQDVKDVIGKLRQVGAIEE